jgi:RNA polymerase sigma-70 factor (ECF subfamily)
MLDPERERMLVAMARDGDQPAREAAFQEIFTALRRPVFALCRNLTGNATEAEDVLQEVFLAVYRALPRFRGDSQLSTWIHRIAIRTALRSSARGRRRATIPLETEPVAPVKGDPLVAAELIASFRAALAGLPFRERVVLSLFSVEGLSHAEIAEILGIPVGTVWSRLHKARKRLLRALEP